MNSQLVRADTGEVVNDVYHQMDRMDEQQILDEIKGASLEKLVYISGNIKMLSLAGVREAVRRLNAGGQARIRITDREPIVTETDDYVEVRVYAEDALNGGGSWGFKRQDKKTARGFALEMALSKAQRNALRSLIPEQWVVEMLSAFVDQQRGGRQEQTRIQAQYRQPAMQAPRPEPVPIRPEVVEPEQSAGHKVLERARLAASKMTSNEPASDKVVQHVAGLLVDALGDEADCDLLVKAIFGNGISGLKTEQAAFLDKWAGNDQFKKQALAVVLVARAEHPVVAAAE